MDLFDENGVVTQEIADPAPEVLETTTVDTTPAYTTPEDAQPPEPPQSKEIPNEIWETSRKRAEKEAAQKYAAQLAHHEQLEREAAEALNVYFEGPDLPTILNKAKASLTGRTLQEVAEERQKKEQYLEAQSTQERKIAELEEFQNEVLLNRDLAEIQKLDPRVKSMGDLGADFIRLRAAGVSNLIAYRSILASRESTTNPSMGDVKTTGTKEKEFYTKDEVAVMSQAEVDKNYEKIRKSMTKWR